MRVGLASLDCFVYYIVRVVVLVGFNIAYSVALLELEQDLRVLLTLLYYFTCSFSKMVVHCTSSTTVTRVTQYPVHTRAHVRIHIGATRVHICVY